MTCICVQVEKVALEGLHSLVANVIYTRGIYSSETYAENVSKSLATHLRRLGSFVYDPCNVL